MNTSSEIISTHCEINLIMAANFQRRYLAISNYFSWAKKFQIVMEKLGLWFRNISKPWTNEK